MQAEWLRLYRAHASLVSHQTRVADTQAWLRHKCRRSTAPYVSFSGGKDSLAVLALMATIDRSVPVFTQGDDLDWPQKRAYCESIVAALGFTDYEYRESAISAVAQIRDGAARIAGTFSHVVRDYVRDRHLDTVVLGLRSAESRGRRLSRAVRGRDYVTANNLRHLLPIADWSGRDVLAWLITRDLPLFPLYTWPDPTPPHDRRMSWPIIPNQMQHGEARFVRRHAPDLWYRLVAVAPHLSADV